MRSEPDILLGRRQREFEPSLLPCSSYPSANSLGGRRGPDYGLGELLRIGAKVRIAISKGAGPGKAANDDV